MAIITLSFADVDSQSVYVPLNHWVYNFLERMETKHVVRNVFNNTKPFSRSEISAYLIQIHRRVDQGYRLNRVEQEQLDFLNIEFKEELNRSFSQAKTETTRFARIRNHRWMRKVLPPLIYQNERNFWSWEQDQFQLFFDPILYYHQRYIKSDSLKSIEKIYQFTNGVSIYGNLSNWFGFFINARDNKEWGSKTYRLGTYTLPGLGFVRTASPSFIYHDETEAYIKVGFKYVDFVYGKFENYWGPGHSGSLILSDFATSYDQFKFELTYKKFKFTSLYAYLIDYHDIGSDRLQARKYLAGHRLEITPWDWLAVGFSETVIFASRSFEPSYLNPVMFFRSAEHYLGSPDNMMMGFDIECTPIKNIKFYAELLIDDITTSKLGTGWFGNKLGFLVGVHHVDFLGIDNLDSRLEYCRIEPYVYSHHQPDNRYKHYDTILGHWIGPNSYLLAVQWTYRFSKHMLCSGSYDIHRHGANPIDKNVGGDVDLEYRKGIDKTTVHFLDGDLEKTSTLGLQFSYELFRNLYINCSYKYWMFKKTAIEKKLTFSNEFFISLGINY